MPPQPIVTPIVIDANVGVWAVLPQFAGVPVDVRARLRAWWQADIELIAPVFWVAECTSAIRRAVYTGHLTALEAQTAVNDLFALDIQQAQPTLALCHSALTWAARLRQVRAYDAF